MVERLEEERKEKERALEEMKEERKEMERERKEMEEERKEKERGITDLKRRVQSNVIIGASSSKSDA